MPSTPFIGVRISWEMVAMKSSFARLADFGPVARFLHLDFVRFAAGVFRGEFGGERLAFEPLARARPTASAGCGSWPSS